MKTIDEGTPMVLADGALRPLGLPMSPLELLALIGPPVLLHVNETLAAAWPDRFPVSPNLEAIVAAFSCETTPLSWRQGSRCCSTKAIDPRVRVRC
jgi:3-hydroxyacyl-CoA dehydrogenase